MFGYISVTSIKQHKYDYQESHRCILRGSSLILIADSNHYEPSQKLVLPWILVRLE